MILKKKFLIILKNVLFQNNNRGDTLHIRRIITSIKQFIKTESRTIYDIAISTKLNDTKTKKPKDEPLFITMGEIDRKKDYYSTTHD